MPASIQSAALVGASAAPVEVQVDLSLGLPGFFLVGLPDHACVDAKVRCATALRNAGFTLPQKRITVNLAPADLRKEGASFDLPIALGVLSSSGLLTSTALENTLIVGELSLSGATLPVRGVLPIALLARRLGISRLIVPLQNAGEGALVQGLRVYGVSTLTEAAELLAGASDPAPARPPLAVAASSGSHDFAEVYGQLACKRALEVAAAGAHNVLLIGPPGSGKTMLARRLPGILPPLSFDEAVETTSIWSVAGRLKHGQGLITERPFRAPHHTVSTAGLIGGGAPPRPGEISLANCGALFLDELPEFGRATLEALRQPLEDGEISLVRASGSVSLPANFMLIGAMNPCPCGHATDAPANPPRCHCSAVLREQYRRRVSGPILDRFDVHVEAPPLKPHELATANVAESSAQIRERVLAARERQRRRFAHLPHVRANGQLRGKELRPLCAPTREAMDVLANAMGSFALSARSHDRVLKVARTIADLADAASVGPHHIEEAIQYRTLDRPAHSFYTPPEYPAAPPEGEGAADAAAEDAGSPGDGPASLLPSDQIARALGRQLRQRAQRRHLPGNDAR